jgi:hypothetical protein
MSGQGAYIQLIARDVQDTMTTIQPQMTYFKSVFRSHTNFAREVHEMSIYGDADYGKYFSVRVDRYGDLLGDTYLRVRTTHFNDQDATETSPGGSIQFSGTTLSPYSYGEIAASQLAFGTGDFTIEWWQKHAGIFWSNTGYVFQTGTFFLGGSTNIQLNFGIKVTNNGDILLNRGQPINDRYFGTVTLSSWNHIALVRQSGLLRCYINGAVQALTLSMNYVLDQSQTFTIGNVTAVTPSAQRSSNFFNGWITNFRIVLGTAVYTSNFTVPTVPLSAIPGTAVLLSAMTAPTYIDNSGTGPIVSPANLSWNVQTPFPNIINYHNLCRFGLQLIDYIEIKIGETIIDRHYGRWMDIWSQLVMPDAQYRVFDNMVSGRYWQNKTLPGSGYDGDSIVYIPLMFWYTHNPGLFIPLVALQFHEVFFNIQFRPRNQIVGYAPIIPDILEVSVLGNYYLLDTYERRQFALQPKLEYLIFSTQRLGETTITPGDYNIDITPFFHPIIDLIVTAKDTTAIPFDYHASDETDTLESLLIQFNGLDRFKRRESTYFRCVQPYQHFPSAIAKQNGLDTSVPYVIDYPKGGFYVYSFALNPEKWWQPSGSCNFSSYDTVNLDIKTRDVPEMDVEVWARNYNVLLITGGMGGLVYADKFY